MGNITQTSLLRQYNDEYREQFNSIFFQKDEDEIIEYLKKVILSCQRERFFILKMKK